MTEIEASNSARLIRNFKRARKVPMYIGRTHTGGRIPGGPYTPTQFLGTGAVVGVLLLTARWWTSWGSAGQNLMIALGLPALTLYLLGKIPQAGRSPVSVATGLGKAVTGGVSAATVNGRPQRAPRKPVGWIGAVTIAAAIPADVVAPPEIADPAQRPAPAPAAGLGTEHLLALAHAKRAAA